MERNRYEILHLYSRCSSAMLVQAFIWNGLIGVDAASPVPEDCKLELKITHVAWKKTRSRRYAVQTQVTRPGRAGRHVLLRAAVGCVFARDSTSAKLKSHSSTQSMKITDLILPNYCSLLSHEFLFRECNMDPGTYLPFDNWSKCSRTCPGGERVRFATHTCGMDRKMEVEECGGPGFFGEWSLWSTCSSSCSGEQVMGNITMTNRCNATFEVHNTSSKKAWSR